MKYLSFAVLLAATASVLAGSPEDWLNAPTTNINEAKLVKEIPAALIFEVQTSIFGTASVRLKDKPAVPLESYDVSSLSRGHFSCPTPLKPYLARAVYENGGTGGFHLQRVGTELWVQHSSLGASTGKQFSALITCLDFRPSAVFVTSGGAL